MSTAETRVARTGAAKAALNATLLIGLALGAAACARGNVAVPTDPGFSGTAGTFGADPLGGAGGYGSPATASSFLPGSQVADRVFFTVDQVTLSPQATATLDAQIGWLRANPSAPILIEGHADERGTSEYNMALGSARASAVRNYMVSQGIPDTRLSIITYGRERPVATCPDESCWSQNRRAVTVVTGGAGA
jgi:peptidoglycan-associated lipoprotein